MPNGSIRYSRTGAQTPVWVTAQALTALAGKPLPIAPVRLHASSASGAQLPTPARVRAGGAGRSGSPRARAVASGRAASPESAPAGITAAAARRLNRLARAMGTLAGTALAPMLR
jgi:hypothetical protein